MASGNRHWSLVDADYSQLINKAIDQAADALGVVFAVSNKMDEQQLATIQLNIQAVTSINKYLRVEDYLTALSAVEKAIPLKVDGQNAVFEVTLRSNEEDFLNLIKNSAELIQVEAQKSPAVELSPESQPPVIQSGSETEKSSEVLVSDDVSSEKDAASDSTENQKDPIPVYYYRLNK